MPNQTKSAHNHGDCHNADGCDDLMMTMMPMMMVLMVVGMAMANACDDDEDDDTANDKKLIMKAG